MKRILALGAALAVAGSTGAMTYAAHGRGGPQGTAPTAARTYEVIAGYGDDDYAANVFNPKILRIYAGDTVRWHAGGLLEPHDVAFGSKAVLDALAATLEVVVPNKSGPPTVELNPRLAYPSRGSAYDGTGVAYSGLMAKDSPGNTWSLTFTTPGTYTYYCLIHHVYQVRSGYDDGTPRYTVEAFMPEDLTVHTGDTVMWSLGFHTVSFGPPALLAQLRRNLTTPIPQKSGPPALASNPRVIYPSGGTTYNGTGFVNSGVLVAPNRTSASAGHRVAARDDRGDSPVQEEHMVAHRKETPEVETARPVFSIVAPIYNEEETLRSYAS